MGESQSKAVRLGSSMDVFLLPRDVLFRDFPERCLPHFQDIKECLKVRTVTFLDLLNQSLDDVLVVSHRHRHVTSSFIACAGLFFYGSQQSARFSLWPHPFFSCVLFSHHEVGVTRQPGRDWQPAAGDALVSEGTRAVQVHLVRF